MDNGLTPMVQSASQNWQTVTLGDCVVTNDAIYSPNEAWPFVNYLDTGNITENRISEIQNFLIDEGTLPSRARRKVQLGDIVYSTVRPNQRHFGRIRDVPKNFLASTGFAVMRGRPETACTEYIYWFLAQDHVVEYLHTIAESSTSAYPSIRPADLEQLELSLPPLPEQRRIADILCTLDDKIELNRRMNETLEQMARALYKSWFVDFDPVRAKMDGSWQSGQSLPGLPAELYYLFPDRLVASELGEMPEGWGVGKIGDVASQRRQQVRPDQIDGETAYIGLEHIPRGSIALSEWSKAEGLASGKSRFKEGDILFGKLRPYFHKVGVAPLDGICSTDIVVVSPILADWFGFTLGHLSSTEFVDYTDATSTGTRMPRTNWDDMALYKVPLPTQREAKAYTELIQPWVDKIVLSVHESHSLVAKRNALLPELVSGTLRVGERAQRNAPE